MMVSSSSKRTMCARAWRLDAEFDVAEHPQLANPDTNHIFPEYLARCVDGRKSMEAAAARPRSSVVPAEKKDSVSLGRMASESL